MHYHPFGDSFVGEWGAAFDCGYAALPPSIQSFNQLASQPQLESVSFGARLYFIRLHISVRSPILVLFHVDRRATSIEA